MHWIWQEDFQVDLKIESVAAKLETLETAPVGLSFKKVKVVLSWHFFLTAIAKQGLD